MNKRLADTLKTKFAIKHQYQDALKLLTPGQLDDALTLLSAIQDALEISISDYALDLTHAPPDGRRCCCGWWG